MENLTELQPYSVLMSVYGGENAAFFEQSLESLYIQTYPADEVVLVCDGALDKELNDVIAVYSEKFGGRLVVNRLESHGGTAKCANTGLALCKNEFIMKMDSDDICLDNRAEKQMRYLAEHPDISILGCYIQEFNSGTGEDIATRCPPVENDEIFQNILTITKLLNKYDVICDRIQFDSSYNVTLGYGKVKVNIGKLENLDEKLMQLPYILPSLEGESGTLDLQNYTQESKSVSFERD